MRFVSLFAGIGGIDLGLERAGWTCVAQVEFDAYCQRVLARHWPSVLRHDDVRTFARRTGDNKPEDAFGGVECVRHEGVDFADCACIGADELLDRVGPIDAVVGGFPCQPVSVAGARRGDADERWLWPEMFRVVNELGPRWVVAENVPGLRTLGADAVLADLERAGYAAWPLVVGADDLGAPHRRKRVFIVAHRLGAGLERHAGDGALLDGRGRLGAEPRGSVAAGGIRRADLVADAHGADVRDGEQRLSGRRAGEVRDGGASVAGGNGASAELADASVGGLGVFGGARKADRHADERGARVVADADGGRRGRVGEQEPRGIEGARWHVVDGRGHGWSVPAWPAGPREQQHGWEPPRLIDVADAGVGVGGRRDEGAGRGRGGAVDAAAVVHEGLAREAESGLGLLSDGVPSGLAPRDRRARLKALGNAVVPAVAEAIGRAVNAAESCLSLKEVA